MFVRHIDLARRAGLPVVVHTREAADDTLAALAEHAAGLTVILHCFSWPGLLDEVVARGYYISFAGNVTYKNAADLQAAARAVPATSAAAGDRCALAYAGAPARPPQPAGAGGKRVRVCGGIARRERGRVGRADRGERAGCVPAAGGQRRERLVSSRDGADRPASGESGLRQVSLARIKEFGIKPKRDLGQNFLIDDNILGVILGYLECTSEDVALEIGAGLGRADRRAGGGGPARPRVRG